MSRQTSREDMPALEQALNTGNNFRSRALFKRIRWAENDPRQKELYERLRLDPVVLWIGIAGAVTLLIFGYFAYY